MRVTMISLVILAATTAALASQPEAHMTSIAGPELLVPPAGWSDAVAETPPVIDVCVLRDLPDSGGAADWTVLGNGCLAGNGRFYGMAGNNLELSAGLGDSRVYELDPLAGTVTLAATVRQAVADPNVAAGKLHADLGEGCDGWLYVCTYWGKDPTQADIDAGFAGSALLRYHPGLGRLENMGVIAAGQGIPGARLERFSNIMYGYLMPSRDVFAVAADTNRMLYRGSGDIQNGSRCVMLDAHGVAYFTTTEGRLARLDARLPNPAPTILPVTLPDGGALRAASAPGPDGVIYGMTGKGILFAFDPHTCEVRNLGPNVGPGEYAAVIVVSPNGEYLYYALAAKGAPTTYGTPIIQYKLANGRRKAIAFLAKPVLASIPTTAFSLRLSPDGSTLYAMFNGVGAQGLPSNTPLTSQPSASQPSTTQATRPATTQPGSSATTQPSTHPTTQAATQPQTAPAELDCVTGLPSFVTIHIPAQERR